MADEKNKDASLSAGEKAEQKENEDSTNMKKTKKKLVLKKKSPPSKDSGKKKKITGRRVLNSIIIVLLSLTLIGGVCVFFVLSDIIKDAETLPIGKLDSKDSTRIFDRNGELITTVGMEQRESVKYEQIPQSVIDAFLSIEDSRFFAHNGFDLPRFIKSGIENLSSGSLSQGGSTLTMQMVDNVRQEYLDQPQDSIGKIKLKIQEIWMSMDVEKRVTKKEIMEKYLNKINFGGPARGIQKASQYYFGKDVSQLTLSESAFLAGVINAPYTYNPYGGLEANGSDHYKLALKRRNTTLQLMKYHGYITDEEYQLAKSTELAFQINGQQTFDADPYQAFIDFVDAEVKEQTGDNMYTTAMDIYTTMDKGAQEFSTDLINNQIRFPENDAKFQTGFTLMDNQTGEVLAIGGGRGYGNEEDATKRRNRGFSETMQTGSSIKPLLDYAPTFDYLGWSTAHTIADVPMTYAGTNFQIHNSSGRYSGDVLLGEAVARSLNTTAITALSQLNDKVGTEKLVDMLHNMGFTDIKKENFSLGYGIGGSDMVASPMQMAGAFSIFANKGNYIQPHGVKKIVYKDGETEDYVSSFEEVNIISEDAAYMMSTILNDAVSSKWVNLLQILQSPFPVYAKSGTSDWGDIGKPYGIPETAMRDKWIIAYTSNYTIATWAGYDYDISNYDANTYVNNYKMNVNVPGQVGKAMLNYMHQNHPETPATTIARPSGVQDITFVKGKFPYAAVPEGAPDDMKVTGLIRSQFNKLETLTPDNLETLTTMSASFKDDTSDTVTIKFTPYPDAAKTQPASHSRPITTPVGTITGNVFYDPAFIYGEVVYKATAKVDGKVVGEYTFATDTADQSIPIDYGKTAQICGYYSYKNTATGKSNEYCVDITRKKKPDDSNSSNNGNNNNGNNNNNSGTLPPNGKEDEDDD